MTEDLYAHPVLGPLLDEADAALYLLGRSGAASDNSEKALHLIYVDLGRTLHRLASAQHVAEDEPTEEQPLPQVTPNRSTHSER